jgi:hypothetical protein
MFYARIRASINVPCRMKKNCMASAWLTRKFAAIRRIPIVLPEPERRNWLGNCDLLISSQMTLLYTN